MLRVIDFHEDMIIDLDVTKVDETRKFMTLFDVVFALQYQRILIQETSRDVHRCCDTLFLSSEDVL